MTCNTFKNEISTKIVKTEVGSFRINKENLDKLKKEAENESISLNSLVNKIIDTYVNWYSSAKKLGLIPVTPNILAELFKNLSEDEIKKLAKKQVPTISENLLLFRHEDTLEAFLDAAKDYFTVCGFPFSIQEKNGTRKISLRHNIGKKYSHYLQELIRERIEQLTKEKVSVSITTNTVTFSINQ